MEGIPAATLRAFFIDAKQAGYIPAVKPLLDEMRNKGILIRDGIYQQTLRQAGELPEG